MNGFRARYIRDLIELLERQRGADAFSIAWERLAKGLLSARAIASLRASANTLAEVRRGAFPEELPLEQAEDLLLALDAALGNGSGRLLEETAFELFKNELTEAQLAVRGDVTATMLNLEAR